ncbi:MAG: 2Fe-2S iron-sulfur cluster-binding protein [Sandaracinaceae bacterium]
MASRRLDSAPVTDPVRLEVDGDYVQAQRGEPVAIALAAAGRIVFGRSVKYHRPRGPTCFQGRCDGCLMRVDGVPSVMTCRLPAADGMVVETQNVVGSARRDLLAATDWFFPSGMNHHEMFTWNAALNAVMKKIARRVAGVGELPDEVRAPSPILQHEVDVVVIGAGPAGLVAAENAANEGSRVFVLEEAPQAGGHLRYWPGDLPTSDGAVGAQALAETLRQRAEDAGAKLMLNTAAVGAYDPHEDVDGTDGPAPGHRSRPAVILADAPDGAHRISARRVVIATGRQRSPLAFPNSDRPGVFQLEGACALLACGVLPGNRVLIAGEHPAVSPLGEALREAGAEVECVAADAVLEASGRPELERCVVRDGESTRTVACDALVMAGPSSSAYELAAQLGVPARFDTTGFELGAPPPDVEVVGWARDGDLG